MVEIRHEQATLETADAFAPLLRDADRSEVLALADRVQDALATAVHMSVGEAWLTSFNGEPVALWGVVPASFLTGHAVPWMLSTHAVDRYRKTFFAESRRIVCLLRARHERLGNFVDARYGKALRWARRLGFVTEAPAPFGPHGQLFCKIGTEGR